MIRISIETTKRDKGFSSLVFSIKDETEKNFGTVSIFDEDSGEEVFVNKDDLKKVLQFL